MTHITSLLSNYWAKFSIYCLSKKSYLRYFRVLSLINFHSWERRARTLSKTRSQTVTSAGNRDSKSTSSSKDLKITCRLITTSSTMSTTFSICEKKTKLIMESNRIIYGISAKNKKLSGYLMVRVCSRRRRIKKTPRKRIATSNKNTSSFSWRRCKN